MEEKTRKEESSFVSQKSTISKIKKDMSFGELIQKYPEAAHVLMKFGLHCIGCHMAGTETIEQGCKAHGLDDEKIKELLEEMNNVVSKEQQVDESENVDDTGDEGGDSE